MLIRIVFKTPYYEDKMFDFLIENGFKCHRVCRGKSGLSYIHRVKERRGACHILSWFCILQSCQGQQKVLQCFLPGCAAPWCGCSYSYNTPAASRTSHQHSCAAGQSLSHSANCMVSVDYTVVIKRY